MSSAHGNKRQPLLSLLERKPERERVHLVIFFFSSSSFLDDLSSFSLIFFSLPRHIHTRVVFLILYAGQGRERERKVMGERAKRERERERDAEVAEVLSKHAILQIERGTRRLDSAAAAFAADFGDPPAFAFVYTTICCFSKLFFFFLVVSCLLHSFFFFFLLLKGIAF